MLKMDDNETFERINVLLYRNGNIVKRPTKNLKNTKLLYPRYSLEILALVQDIPHVNIARHINKNIIFLFNFIKPN